MIKAIQCVAIALLLCATSLGAVSAQDVLTAVSQNVDAEVVAPNSYLHSLWETLQPTVAVLLTAAAPVIVLQVFALLWKMLSRVGINVEEEDRKRFHEAATNALKNAIAKYTGPTPNMVTGTVPDVILNSAIDYLKAHNPQGSAKHTDKDLADIILSKAVDVQALVSAGKPEGNTSVVVDQPAGH